MEYRYHLAKYAGKASRLSCPQCERPHCFTPYVDDANHLIDKTVGRCDHESSCGYHLTPSQYFQQHPEARPQGEDWRQAPAWLSEKRNSVPPPANFLPEDLVERAVRLNPVSNFLAFLYSIFDVDTVQMLVDRYRLGVTRDGAAIFYQIDLLGRIRTGKIIQYNPETGHRIKDTDIPVDWVHARLKKQGLLPESWNVSQCLFGEHLLAQYPDALVCLVEAEKTAVICSAFCPKFVWLATGGKTQLGDRLDVLKGRKVLVFPDIDAYAAWRTLDQATQTLWHEYGKEAVPHKPPFDNQAHISGQNLFVSAYHGFATLGEEHIPTPQRFVKFPPYAVRMENGVRVDGSLVIPTVVTMAECLDAGRYRLLAKLQLTEPGKGRHPGLLRNYLADANCDAAQIRVTVPGYTEQVGFELEQILVHAQFILIDNVTGFRSQSHQQSFILSVR